MFDAISGIFKSGASALGDFVTDFGGGAFSAVDEFFRGGTLSAGEAAGTARRAGIGLGGLFTDIGTSFLTGQVEALAGATSRTPRTRAPTPTAAPRTLGDMLADVKGLPELGLAAPSRAADPRFRFASTTARRAPVTDPRDVSAASLGGLLGNIASGALQEFLGPPTAVGRAVERLFGFEAEGVGPMARALPGGAMIPFDPVGVAGGRLFNATQNLNTGAITVRAKRELQAINPSSGRIETWRHKGACLLFAEDFASVKRVRRVARKAGRKR